MVMMYFYVSQVGRFEVNLISPDSKTVVLEKNFKDISSCCQVDLFLLYTSSLSLASLLQSWRRDKLRIILLISFLDI